MVTPDTETLEFPVFSTETDLVAVLPTSTLPNARLVGLATNVRVVVVATPVPVRVAVRDPSMLVEMLADPDMVPADCGSKWSVKEMLFPGATSEGRVTPLSENTEAETEVVYTSKLVVPVFFSVTVCVAVEPTLTLLKFKDDGVSDIV